MVARHALGSAILALLVACVPGAAVAADYTFAKIEVPGAVGTWAFRMNAHGDVVGRYADATGAWGFVLSDGKFRTIKVPGSALTFAHGINDNGDIVGIYRTKDARGRFSPPHGFLMRGSAVTTLDVPGSMGTCVWDISDDGEVTGQYEDRDTHKCRGFVWRDGRFTSFDVPQTKSTAGLGVNARGEVVGDSIRNNDEAVSYLRRDGQFTILGHPNGGHGKTSARGIGAHGEVVGYYENGDTNGPSGYVYRDGVFESIRVPEGAETYAYSIAPNGTIVGYYWSAPSAHNHWTVHGFVATPSRGAGR